MAWGLPVAQATYGSVSLRRHRKTLPMDGSPPFFSAVHALPFPLLRMNRGCGPCWVSWWGSGPNTPNRTKGGLSRFDPSSFGAGRFRLGRTHSLIFAPGLCGSSGVKSEGVQAGKLQPGGHPPVTGANLEEKKNPFFFSPICPVRVASQAFSGTHTLGSRTQRKNTMFFFFGENLDPFYLFGPEPCEITGLT